MIEGSDISTLYREFADALTEVLAENAAGLARRGRLARARAAIKKHPNYSHAGYLRAVEAAFENWEAMGDWSLVAAWTADSVGAARLG
jgi:hypothetical protein